MKPKTVAFFSDAPYRGGAEKYLCLLAGSIDRDRFSPVLIMNSNPELESMKRRLVSENVPVHEVSLGLPGTMRGTGRFRRLIRSLGPDILHLNLPGPHSAQYSLVAPIARFAGARHVVSTEHLPMVPSFLKGRVLKSFATNWIERVITVSRDNRRYLKANHGIPAKKIRVVHIGIPDDRAAEPAGIRDHLRLPADSFLLLMAAALEERKGHETAFSALAALPPSVHLLVAGTGSREESLRSLARDAGIPDRAHFLGHRDDVPALMRDADLLVLPSRLEATPYVIIEAMAAGLPAVASNIYGIPELIDDGRSGLLADPADSGAFAGHIERLMADADLRREMGAAGRRRYEDGFTLAESVSKTVAVYDELLGRA